MAVMIRLKRTGAKKAPFYRIVVMEGRQPRNGKEIELIGRYNPRTNPITLELDKEKAQKWLANGATPSDPMRRLLTHAGLLEPKKIAVPKKAKADAPDKSKAKK